MHMQLAEFPAMLDYFLSTPEALIGVEVVGIAMTWWVTVKLNHLQGEMT